MMSKVKVKGIKIDGEFYELISVGYEADKEIYKFEGGYKEVCTQGFSYVENSVGERISHRRYKVELELN